MLWKRNGVRLALFGSLVAMALGPGAAMAGFLTSTMGWRGVDGNTLLRMPALGEPGGLDHALDPSDWDRFRVRVKHQDAYFPEVGWVSDEFKAAAPPLKICEASDCHAPEIFVGLEQLNWQADDRYSVILEAKRCTHCMWQSFELR